MAELPPSFYLTHLGNRESPLVVLFTDVKELPVAYSSTPVTVELPLMNVPYRAQGFGGGRTWSVSARINPWHAFLGGGAEGGVTLPRSGPVEELHRTAYEDYLALEQLIEEYGPSPIVTLHQPDPSQASRGIDVMLTQFGAILPLSQSRPGDPNAGTSEIYPNTIQVEMTLVEYRRYKARLGA